MVVLFWPAVMLAMMVAATLSTEDSCGIEKGKLVSIVLLGKRALKMHWHILGLIFASLISTVAITSAGSE